MRQELKYEVLQHDNHEEFNEMVTSYIENGWKLQGGVSVLLVDNIVWWFQAVTKNVITNI
jgi:hypothetical protein